MKIETLKDRIKKAEEKIAKSNGTLERHKAQLVKRAKMLTDKGVDLNNYDKFNRDVIDHDTYWDICEYEHKLEDVESTNKKIREATISLEKYQKQLSDQLAKEEQTNNLVPEVLNIFLENWKQKCFEYFTVLANEYIAIKCKSHNEYEITKEELELLTKRKYIKWSDYEEVRAYSDEEIEDILNGDIGEYQKNNIKAEIKDRHLKNFIKGHFASDMVVVNKIVDYDEINNNALSKILGEDVKIKKEMFISRIKECIGEIKDLSGLKVVGNGELNGVAVGVKCNAKVETITAGGYATQCFHFRVLVNAIKQNN